MPDLRLKSHAGYRNLQTTLGFWTGAGLLVIGVTGAVMAFPWAERGLYALAGEKAPARRAEGAGLRPSGKPPAAAPAWNPTALDSLWADARGKVPDWSAQSQGQRWRAAISAFCLALVSWTAILLGIRRLGWPKRSKSTQVQVTELVAEAKR